MRRAEISDFRFFSAVCHACAGNEKKYGEDNEKRFAKQNVCAKIL